MSQDLAKAFEDLAAEAQRCAAMLRGLRVQPLEPVSAQPAQVMGDCGCSLFARCDFHEQHKPKGCTCNGPFYSASCPTAAHAAHGRAWPPGDPAAVG